MTTYHPSSQSMKRRAYAATETLRARIDEGLEDLPDSAKARIRKAREAAISAQAQVESEARRVAATTRDVVHENPLLVGALALAAGAAIAAALPRTAAENRAIGGHRDALFDEAERIFDEEKSKALARAKALAKAGHEKITEGLSGDVSDPIAKASSGRGNVKTTGTDSARNGAT
ncbi:hypothetical protein [Tropicimonas sp. S265A]|uniref:hypothetical protein n=1 Tax=Tropicimonas sp. S265A TaxID=3415134 RepID=UPI003C7AE315